MAKAKQENKQRETDNKKQTNDNAQKETANSNEQLAEAVVSPADQPTSALANEPASKPTVAKAGRRSAKAIKEIEEKEAKEQRKTEVKDTKAEAKPKVSQKPPRSKLERKGKKFRDSAKLIEKDKQYTLAEAVELATKTSPVKFDATVELHINLNVDPKQADQNVRGTVALPAGTGKEVRITVADDALLAKLDKGLIDFDVLIAAPDMMPKLGKYAKLLGPKGLMPNPKSGTVTSDVAKAVQEAKAGRVEYRVDSTGIIHVGIGKVSFGADKLLQNAQTIMTSVRTAKPASVKTAYLKSAFVTTSMGPSIPLTLSEN